MQLAKETFLDMRFVHRKGLILKWNFKDFLKDTVYFHHLFVLLTQQTPEISELLSQYYKKIKEGDLIAFLFIDGKGRCRKVSWTQKSPLDPSPVPNVVQRMAQTQVDLKSSQDMFQLTARQTSNTHSNIVTNFVTGSLIHDQLHDMKKFIEASRKEGSFPYLCSIMCPEISSEISVNRGINVLNTEDPKLLVEAYHQMVNNSALKRVRVGIQCIGGELGEACQTDWRALAFNKIERQYYGPSVSYSEDVITFLVRDPSEDCQFDFLISLDLNLFNEQKVLASKKVRLFLSDDRNVGMTLGQPNHSSYFMGNYELIRNPYRSHSQLRLTKIFPDGRQKNEEKFVDEVLVAERVRLVTKGFKRQ